MIANILPVFRNGIGWNTGIFAGTNEALKNDSLLAFKNIQSHRKYISDKPRFLDNPRSILNASAFSPTSLRDLILKSVKTIKTDVKRAAAYFVHLLQRYIASYLSSVRRRGAEFRVSRAQTNDVAAAFQR